MSGYLLQTLMYHETDARLHFDGHAAFLVELSKKADASMARAGGIKPFQYESAPEGWGLFKLTVSEVSRSIRTDAQRALIRAKAAHPSRKSRARQSSQRPARSA